MKHATLALATLALLFVPVAGAQSLTEPVERHAEDKKDQATSDPTGFVRDHSNESSVRREADWSVAYGCFVVDRAHDDYGTPDPELEQCEDYEEALGIEEENETEEPIGQAQNLTEEPIAEAEELAEGALESVDRIVKDPKSAPSEALRVAMLVVGFALWLVEYILGGLAAATTSVLGAADGLVVGLLDVTDSLSVAAGSAGAAGTGLVDGAVSAVGALGDVIVRAVTGIGDAVWKATDAIADGLGAIGGGLAAAGSAVANGLGSACSALGEAVGAVGVGIADAANSIGDFIGGIFDGSGTDAGEGDATDDLGSLPEATQGLLDQLLCVECLTG